MNEAMNERRLPIGVLTIVPVVIGMALYAFTGQAQVEDPAAAAMQTAEAAASLIPAATPTWFVDSPPQWTPGPEPTPEPYSTPQTSHGVFHDGAWVRVNAGSGDCLNARNSPSLQNEYVIINLCLPDGFEGLISGSTQESEGHWWWYLVGVGYVAEEYLEYIRDFDVRTNTVPELAGQGRVAFLRGQDIWVMNADGSGQRLIVDRPDDDPARGYAPGPEELTWAPSGATLSYNIQNWASDGSDGSIDLHVVSLAGETATEQIYVGVAGGGWSPDGVHLGIVREAKPIQMGDGYQGIPAVLDVTTGGQLVLGSEPSYQQKAPAFNFDGSLLMVNYAKYEAETSTVAILIYDRDGVEVRRIVFAQGTGYASPRWSPIENRIAMHFQDERGASYAVYDLATSTFIARSDTPKTSERIGPRCGGGDMWNTEWSRDGQRILYSFMFGDTGANGIWSWDVATGERGVIAAASAGSATSGGGEGVMFAAGGGNGYGHIFVGSSGGGFPRIVTDGYAPAWFVAP